MDFNEIGKTIKDLRTKFKMSQDDLANKIYVSRQAISNWECGKTYPDIDNIKKLSEIFNVKIENIIMGNNKNNNVCEKLYTETIRSKKRIKGLFIVSLILSILLIFSILFYFFLDTYKQIRVYRVDAGNGVLQDGLFIVTKDSWHLKAGTIKSSKNIKRVRLYLKIKEKEELICDGLSDTYTLSERIGYNELFRFSEQETINNMYIELTYEDETKESFKVEFQLKYENSEIFRKKEINITEIVNKEDEELNLLEQGIKKKFKKESDRKSTYTFKYNNEEFEAVVITGTDMITIYSKNKYRLEFYASTQHYIKYTKYDKDENQYMCTVDLDNFNRRKLVICEEDLELEILGIYDAFVKEMDAL